MNTPYETVKAMFITASGRTLSALAKAADLKQENHLVNEALTQFKAYRDGLKKGQVLVLFNSANDKAQPLDNMTLDATIPMTEMVSMLFPAGHKENFQADFGTTDSASILTEAFYFYDRLITEKKPGLDIALVDDPHDIKDIRFIQLGMQP